MMALFSTMYGWPSDGVRGKSCGIVKPKHPAHTTVVPQTSTMAVKNCIFCGHHLAPSAQRQPHSRTAEHVFAKWFRCLSNHQIMNMYIGSVDGMNPELKWRPTLNNLTMKGVCQACNCGWMSSLETAVEPLMVRIFGEADVDELSGSEVDTVARWTAKTAITLSYATPQHAPVPLQASHSLHPDYQGPVRFGFFYSKITADRTLENGHLQVVYGRELGLVGTPEVAGTRLVLCLNNHCLIVDFPPTFAGFGFDLSESCSAQLWPTRRAAGVATLSIDGPATIDRVLLSVCAAIKVQVDTRALRV